jgi:hypothetical protein
MKDISIEIIFIAERKRNGHLQKRGSERIHMK